MRSKAMRFNISLTNMIALPLALAFSPPLDGEEGTEFAIVIGPFYVSISWGY